MGYMYVLIADNRTLVSMSFTVAIDRRQSKMTVEDRTRSCLLQSPANTIEGSQTITEACFHMIADNCRTFCDLRSSVMIWKPAFGNLAAKLFFSRHLKKWIPQGQLAKTSWKRCSTKNLHIAVQENIQFSPKYHIHSMLLHQCFFKFHYK